MKNSTRHRRYEIGEWRQDEENAWWAWIYVSGDLHTAEMVCRKLCFPRGLCVTVKPVRYIFAGGVEDGMQVGMIQYPPFPEHESKLMNKAIRVGKAVAEACCQWSFTIVTPTANTYFSRRRL